MDEALRTFARLAGWVSVDVRVSQGRRRGRRAGARGGGGRARRWVLKPVEPVEVDGLTLVGPGFVHRRRQTSRLAACQAGAVGNIWATPGQQNTGIPA